MKKIKYILLLLLLLIPINSNAKEKLNVYIFHQESCPHCQAELEYLDEIDNLYDDVVINKFEISKDESNYYFLMDILEKTGINTGNSVPFTIIGTDYYVGFSSSMKTDIKNSIDKFLKEERVDVVEMILNNEDISNIKYNQDTSNIKEISIFGKTITFDAKSVSLPLISMIIGFVDGFNPCSMWVLLFLIGMLINMEDKKKRWILGLAFILTSGLMYFLIMTAWLNVVMSFTTVVWLRWLIALVALVAGTINLCNYIKSLKKDTGCTVVEESKRTKIFDKIKKIISEKSFFLALIGIITLAISVNLVELACSAGLPLVFTEILAFNDLTNVEYILYMILYVFFFLIDDIVIFIIAMVALNIKGISSKYSKYSHLIGGLIMVIIGILMLLKPEWLMFNFN